MRQKKKKTLSDFKGEIDNYNYSHTDDLSVSFSNRINRQKISNDRVAQHYESN